MHDLLQHVDDGHFVRVEAAGELFFQRGEFLREVTGAEERFAHLDEGADDPTLPRLRRGRQDARLCSARAVQDVGGLKGTVLSEGPRAVGFSAMPTRTGRKLRPVQRLPLIV